MTKLAWGATGTRTYEAGVDRGVLYINGIDGVPWNGLTSVKENPSGGAPTPYYLDGVKYLNISSTEEFIADLEAYSSPDEFANCDGSSSIYSGLIVTQQPRKQFGLSYRTLIGNDTNGQSHGYKIHIVYNALAGPSSKDNTTLSDSSTPSKLTWNLTTTPPAYSTYKPTAHMIIDSTKTDPDLLAVLEGYLYGADGIAPRLPTPSQLVSQFGTWNPMALDASLNFIGVKSNSVSTITNLATNPSFESVATGTTVVRTNLATNSSFEGATAGINYWPGVSGLAVPSSSITGGLFGSGHYRLTWTTASTISGGFLSAHGATIKPNLVYTLSGWVRPSIDQTMSLYGNFYNGSIDTANISRGNTLTLLANVWTRVWVTATSGLNDNAMDVNFYGDLPFPVGATMDLDGLLIEQTDQLRPYFDGSTPDALGFDYGWTGVANASTSTAKAAVVPVITNLATNPSFESVVPGTALVRTNLCVNPGAEVDVVGWIQKGSAPTITRSTEKSHIGVSSVKIVSTAGSGSGVGIDVSGLVVGAQYVMSGYVLVPNGQSSTVVSTVASIGYGTSSTKNGLWEQISMLFTATLGTHNVGFDFLTGFSAGNYFYIDSVLIEQTDQLRPYFDGSTPDALGFDYGWTGVANASTSTAKAAVVEVRRNLVENPIVRVNTAGWFSGAALTRTSAVDKWWVNAPAGTHTYASFGGVVGRFYSISMRVKGPVGTDVSLQNTDNVVGGFAGAGSGTIPASGEIVLSARSGVATGGTTMNFGLIPSAGQTGLMVTEAFAEEVSASGILVGSYFDGTTPALGDFINAWSGIADTSTSIKSGVSVSDAFGGNNTTIVLSLDGARVIPKSSNSDSYMAPGGDAAAGAFRYNLVAGKTYTIIATCRLDAKQTGTPINIARAIVPFVKIANGTYINYPSTSALNEVGTTKLRTTMSIPSDTTEAFIRLYNGASSGNGDVYWSDFLIVEGNYTGEYFDGSSVNLSSDLMLTWSGTPHASTSVKSGIEVAGSNYNGLNCVVYRSAEKNNTGAGSIVVRRSNSGVNAGMYQRIYMPVGLHTIIAKIWIEPGFLTGLDFVQIYVSGSSGFTSEYVTTVGQWVTIRATSTNPTAGLVNVFVYAPDSVGIAETRMWVDTLQVIAGDYTEPYFDGSTTPFLHKKQLAIPAWSGAAHASTSSFSYLTDLPVVSNDGDAHVVTNDLWVLIDGQWRNNGTVPLQN